mmetsp:Transcript_13594/g.25536  ORF Transcript_13594/g.25536 Transcript_13594/m.25536 type:complete len:82 (+) Transcript_13594:8611-8856(+)
MISPFNALKQHARIDSVPPSIPITIFAGRVVCRLDAAATEAFARINIKEIIMHLQKAVAMACSSLGSWDYYRLRIDVNREG